MIQWPLRFVDPQNHPQNEGFWTLVGRQLLTDCEQTNGGSGNSGTVCTRRHDPLQVDMPRFSQGGREASRTCPLLTVDADIGCGGSGSARTRNDIQYVVV